jgi:AbrB family looped-hinge helix DNA binding protein
MKLYGATTVGQRGQIVLPADLRKERGIKPGDKLLVMSRPESGVPIILIDADSMAGMLTEAGEALERISKEVADAKK